MLLVVVVIVVSAFEFSRSTVLREGQATVVVSTFAFSNQKAIHFFQSLGTPSGLLRVYPGSTTIYLSDDQQLDYAALTKLGDLTLANEVNSTLGLVLSGLYGDFNPASCSYGNWNGVDVAIGLYLPIPCQGANWNMYSGQDLSLGWNYSKLPSGRGFLVEETEWNGPVGSGYARYADLELYYSMNQLHFGDYGDALGAFAHANSMWNGYGFADQAYNASIGYTSFKLALDLIAFKELMNNSHTEGSVVAYASTINQVEGIMSRLQGADGGVATNYLITNGAVQTPQNTYENGETTSLFVLSE